MHIEVALYSAFFAASRRLGAVPEDISFSFCSMSAAHRAAPTAGESCQQTLSRCGRSAHCLCRSPVLVKEKTIEAKGIISRRVATVPKPE